MSSTQKDLFTYHKMCEPFASAEEANNAIDGFWDEVYALRVKHKIPDVHVVLYATYLTEDGEVSECAVDFHAGDVTKSEMMLAWAFGRAQADREEKIGKFLAAGTVQRGKKRS